ncbi:MAG: NTP transferase domain-containing protein [Actinomycetales bacterium]|nr:NTP transferase domain-containing protein [Actinomycetales bacterium]
MSGPTLVILGAGRARRYGGLKQLAPIGRHGEGVIDMIAADAIAGGFDEIVVVINHDTGPTIQAHVAKFWPEDHRVSFAFQDKLRGTVDAVLTAEPLIDPATPFAVSNADDLYGRDAFASLCAHLSSSPNNCLVAYELENSLVGDLPVSRGTCEIEGGRLVKIVERRNVHFTPEGLCADDDLSPYYLDPSMRVSMNLWGFQPAVWPLMHAAMAAYRDGDPEVLLPTFVADAMANHAMVVDALLTSSRCIGVTHAEDLPLAQFLVREEIKAGQRPEYAFAPRA